MRTLPLLLLLAVTACGRDIAATPDPTPLVPVDTTLARSTFSSIALVDRVTGVTGLPDSVRGLRFSRKAQLRIVASALRDGTASWVVESRTSGGTAWQAVAPFTLGENAIDIGPLPADLYLLSGMMAGVRIAAITFVTE